MLMCTLKPQSKRQNLNLNWKVLELNLFFPTWFQILLVENICFTKEFIWPAELGTISDPPSTPTRSNLVERSFSYLSKKDYYQEIYSKLQSGLLKFRSCRNITFYNGEIYSDARARAQKCIWVLMLNVF